MTPRTDTLISSTFATVITERKLASKTQRAKTKSQTPVTRSYTYSRNGLSLISFSERTVLKTNRPAKCFSKLPAQSKGVGGNPHGITQVTMFLFLLMDKLKTTAK
jgi:hypothetical protein